MSAILKACADISFPARVKLVISNKENAEGLNIARAHNIETAVVLHQNYDSRESFDKALLEALNGKNIDLICLAGFMRILTPVFITVWEGRILNMHPSLLPKYRGLNPQKQALEDNATKTGCSVHYVTAELDAGPVITQREVVINKNDTEESLSQKILAQEHFAYPEAIRIVANQVSSYTKS